MIAPVINSHITEIDLSDQELFAVALADCAEALGRYVIAANSPSGAIRVLANFTQQFDEVTQQALQRRRMRLIV